MTFDLGEYRALEKIGAGGTATVYRGVELGTDRVVALKVLPADRLEQLEREAALAALVDHPHLPEVFGLVADDEHAALVTEFAAGGTLAALLKRRGRLTEPETLTVLLPLAAVLATAHERGVVHGDLSAGNVLFDLAGRPLLADLGAARAAAELVRPVMATPCDAAPELARGQEPDAACDMFSLGSLALACLTGRHAWPAESLRDVVIQATLGQWPDPGGAASPELVAVVRALLDPLPAARPGGAEVVMDLRACGRPRPVELAVESPEPASAGPVSRPRHLLAEPESESESASESASESESGPEPAPWPEPEPGWPTITRQPDEEPDENLSAAPDAVTRIRPDAAPIPVQEPAQARGDLLGRIRAIAAGRGRAAGAEPVGAEVGAEAVEQEAGRRRWLLRRVLVTVVLVVVGLLAVQLGLWWAGWEGRSPTAAVSLSASAPAAPDAPISMAVERSAVAARTKAVSGGTVAGVGSSPAVLPTGSAGSAARAMSTSTPAGPSSPAASSSVPGPSGSIAPEQRWVAVVAELDSWRGKALVSRDARLLDRVYTADCPGKAQDVAVIADLRARGLTVSGAVHVIVSAEATSDPRGIRLRVTDRQPAYAVSDTRGVQVGVTVARGAAERELLLVAVADGYRIAEVSA